MKKIIIVTVVMMVLILGAVVSRYLSSPEVIPPASSKNSLDVFPQDDSLVTETGTAAVSQRMRSRYADFLIQPGSADVWTTFSEGGRRIPLQTAITALDGKIEPSLNKLLDQAEWQMYTCTDTVSKAGVRDIIFSMHFSLQPTYPGDLYTDQIRSLQVWERSLFNDVLPILYPQTYYLAAPAQTSEFRTNGQYPAIDLRQANIRFVDGTESTIGYIFVGDELLIGTNEGCLLRAQEMLYDTSA